jgi:hypothetical protein
MHPIVIWRELLVSGPLQEIDNEPTSSTSTLSATATSTTVSTALKKLTFSLSQMREWGLCFRCDEKGYLIKDCPKPLKTSRGPESNIVGTVNSGTEAVDSNARRDKSGGAKRPWHSRGSCFIAREQIRGMYPSNDCANPKSKCEGLSIVVNKLAPNNDACSIPGTTVSTISVVPRKTETSETPLQRYPSMYAFITINDIISKTLIHTGASDDFVTTHFITINRFPGPSRNMIRRLQSNK